MNFPNPNKPIRILVLGLGNELLSDDGAGIEAARELENRLTDLDKVTVIESARAGFAILDMFHGFDEAYLIDAIQTGIEPGTVTQLSLDDFRGSSRLVSQHDMDLATAVKLGRKMGYTMPDAVYIWAIEAEDLYTFHEGCSDAVRNGVREVVDLIEKAIRTSLS